MYALSGSDRKAAALVGRYQSTVSEQYVPYIMPQEHGAKCDVRWLALTNATGSGLRVDGPLVTGLCSVSARPAAA